jgi:sulfonate transport system ATP-binding protein
MIASTLRRLDGFVPARPASSRRDIIDREIARDRTATGLGITLRGLSKAFDGGKPVIDGLDLHVPAGQFVAVVGRSGCGKSTLLRLILGLEAPSAGRVAVEGGAGPRRIMFQEPRLLPWARVLDNVAVGLGRGGTAAERRERAAAALAEVGLAEKAGQWPSTLSGGQRQRVALARALVSHPGLLALDEPLGALDALTRIDMQAMIERIWRAQGFTALLVTHDVAEAVALADRILVVEAGRIALDVAVTVPRPRRRGDPELAALEGRILDHLLDGRA